MSLNCFTGNNFKLGVSLGSNMCLLPYDLYYNMLVFCLRSKISTNRKFKKISGGGKKKFSLDLIE